MNPRECLIFESLAKTCLTKWIYRIWRINDIFSNNCPERGAYHRDLSVGYPIAESPVIETRDATTIRMQLVNSDSRVDVDVLGSLGLGFAPNASTVLSKNYNRVLNVPIGFNEIKLKVATGDYTVPTTVNYKVVMRV